ncbi:MAG: hypothetical protein ACI8RD_006287 [Bacillariaceae sp.]|jgi:hypothetical protein
MQIIKHSDSVESRMPCIRSHGIFLPYAGRKGSISIYYAFQGIDYIIYIIEREKMYIIKIFLHLGLIFQH